MKILFTICGRAGSKGFKNKNLKELNEVPLVFYTLAVINLFAKKHYDDEVDVAINTDSQQLIDLVKSQRIVKDIVFVPRKDELAGDKVAIIDVIRDKFLSLNEEYDVIVDLDITSPLRSLADVEGIIRTFNNEETYELVTSVVPARRSPYFNMVEKRGNSYKKICNSSYTTRQDAPVSYELNASIYAYRPSFLSKPIADTILDHCCGISIMKDYLVLDIDSEEDFQMMQILHGYYIKNDEGLKEVFEEAKLFN